MATATGTAHAVATLTVTGSVAGIVMATATAPVVATVAVTGIVAGTVMATVTATATVPTDVLAQLPLWSGAW